jgi:hypothetical protein
MINVLSNLFWEPNLLDRNRKPDGDVELDTSSRFIPNKLLLLFNGSEQSMVNYVDNTVLSTSDGATIKSAIANNDDRKSVDVAHSSTLRSRYNIVEPFSLTATVPWEITWRARKGTTEADWAMICGDNSNTSDFIAFNELTAYIRFRNSSLVNYDINSLPSFEASIKTYTLTSDGAGVGSCNLRLYTNGVISGTVSSTTPTMSMAHILSAYSLQPNFSFEGVFTFFRCSTGVNYTDNDVAWMHDNLYSNLKSANVFPFPRAAVAAAGVEIFRRRIEGY